MFRITLGCSNVLNDGHVDSSSGIFGVLEEKIRRVKTGNIIPAKDNTSCKCRRTARCNSDCQHSVYGIKSGFKISYRQEGKRL
jgi:hypothetical protein